MFKKALSSALILFLLIILYIFYYCFHILPNDVKRYEKYLESVQNKEACRQEKPTYQNRTLVQKDIWHYDHGSRLHYQIRAASSILTLTPVHKAFSLQEDLKQIDCALQEKLYKDSVYRPMQQLSTFYAEQGVYDFTHHQFSAGTVFLKFYTLPGSELPIAYIESPFLQGQARSVALTLSSHGPVFHADKFTAQMDLKDYEH